MQERVRELEEEHQRKTVILGVDRLDYTKGLVQKLRGFEYLLQQHPDLKGKVTLIQIAIPSREDVKEYQDLEKELSTIIGKINGEHCTHTALVLLYAFDNDWSHQQLLTGPPYCTSTTPSRSQTSRPYTASPTSASSRPGAMA